MTDSTTYISRSPREQDGQNLSLLQKQALASIQALAAETWTDHNPTDPGITLLEALSFVISDLSYRLDFPIRDLMAWPPEQRGSAESPFWLASDILPSNGVTLADYQRMMLDIPEVRAVILAQDEQRRYQVTVATEDAAGISSNGARLALADKIRTSFLNQRNVNDDIASLNFIEKHEVTVRLDLVFYQLEDPVATLTEVLQCLREVVSPSVKKQSLESLMDEGYTPDQILLGPQTKNGIALLEKTERGAFPQSIFASDLIAVLSEVSALKAINKLTFENDSASGNEADEEEIHWRYELKSESDELFSFSLGLETTLDCLTIEIDGQPYRLSDTQKSAVISAMQTIEVADSEVSSSVLADLVSYQQGKYRELKQYFSLQHEFPAIYKLVDDRFNGDINTTELAQVMQLKGFLTLFDQILADQFAQLETLKSLLARPSLQVFETLAELFDKMLASESLSTQELNTFWHVVEHLPMTYVSQPITDISGMENLLGDYWSSYSQAGFQPLAEQAFSNRQLDRLNRSMAHLLARYAETTIDANLLQYEPVFTFYGQTLKSKFPLGDIDDTQLLKNLVQLKQVVDKAMLLADYDVLSRFRAGGFNYLNPEPKKNFAPYLSHRILRFLGVKNTSTMPLSTGNREGIYLLEGALLWSGDTAPDSELSRTLYFVLPDWTTRFAHTGFQALLEEVIAKETPMHLSVKVIYLGRQSMNHFEQLYYAWLNAMTQCPFPVFFGGEQISSKYSDSKEWLILLSTSLREFLAAPLTVDISLPFYYSAIGDGSFITPAVENEIPPADKTNFRVHYLPLDFLKPRSAIGSAYINPDDPSVATFNINIKTPNFIERLP